MDPQEMLASQLVALAWLRCLQEEGVDFVNKRTGEVEKDERVIFEAFESGSGDFDLPSAKASRYGMEKNLLEAYGSYCLYNDDPRLLSLLLSDTLRNTIKKRIENLKQEKIKP